MRKTSEAYRDEMRFPFRNQWLLTTTIGLVQEKFQATATSTVVEPISFLSNNYNDYLFNDSKISNQIATFEKDLFKADGKTSFIDKLVEDNSYYGLMSDSLSDMNNNLNVSMIFNSTTSEKGLKGLTLYFFKTYPTLFNISGYQEGVEIFNKNYTNDSFVFETRDVFGDVDTLKITIKKMNQPHVRFRIRYVLFGIGVSLGNSDFLSTGGSYKEQFHPCSIELPQQEFSLNIDNFEDQYDVENMNSLINLASVGQDISLSVGYKFSDGNIEQVFNQKLELNSFDLNHQQLNLKAVDFLRNENTPVEIGEDFPFTEQTTLYDIAMYVRGFVQNKSFKVDFDESLKDIHVNKMKLNTSCKEALMMIASAARCTMRLNTDGLDIKRLVQTTLGITASSDRKVPYSNLSQLMSIEPSVYLASFDLNSTRADGTFLFPSREISENFKTGYISDTMSDEYGRFTQLPYIQLLNDETVIADYLVIRFKDCNVKRMNIKTYIDDMLIENIQLDDLNNSLLEIDKKFKASNKMIITIQEIHEPFKRAQIDYISFDRKVYDTTLDLCMEKPQLSLKDTVKNIIVKYTTLDVDDTEIVNEIIMPCNSRGVDFEYNNPFITEYNVALDVAKWLVDYYKSQVYYSIDTIGDPSVELNDLMKIPNTFNDGLTGGIENNEIAFQNGGIRGKMIVRKGDYRIYNKPVILTLE